MDRRTFLTALVVGTAGCGGRPLPARSTASTPGSPTSSGGPYRRSGAPELVQARAIRVFNEGDEPRYVTVSVYDGDQHVFLASREIASAGRETFPAVVGSPGRYRVVVETASGLRAEREWIVSGTLGDLDVRVGQDLALVQLVRCDPTCPPLSSAGTVDDLELAADAQQGVVNVVNERDRHDDITLSIRRGSTTVFEYDYAIPPLTHLAVLVTRRLLTYTVAVTRDGRTWTHPWWLGDTSELFVSLGEEIRFSCSNRPRDLFVGNDGALPHSLTVAVHADERPVFERRFEVDPGGGTTVANALPSAWRYRFSVTMDGEESRIDEWSGCLHHGPFWVVATDDRPSVVLRAAYLFSRRESRRLRRA